MRRRAFTPLIVGMNGRRIGTLTREASGRTAFAYDAHWLTAPRAFAVSKSIPLLAGEQTGQEILAYFDNLLPDNPTVLKQIATRLGAEGSDTFSLLSVTGRDCVGALQLVQDEAELESPSVGRSRKLTEAEVASLLSSLASTPLGMTSEREFRISIAGAQEKTALIKTDAGWAEPLGSTPTTHIFKPALGVIGMNGVNVDMSDSVANEHYCLELLRQFGLPTARTEMARFGDVEVLIVERFDRLTTSDGKMFRLPQEDMCQALGVPSTQKYESEGGPGIVDILEFLSGSDDPSADRAMFMKACILFWLIGATDGHAKNFSIRLMPNGGYRLTPLYDVLSVQPAKTAKQLPHKYFKTAMKTVSGGGYKIDYVSGEDFVQTGLKAKMPEAMTKEIIDQIRDEAHTAFKKALATMPKTFPRNLHDSIYEGAQSRLLRL